MEEDEKKRATDGRRRLRTLLSRHSVAVGLAVRLGLAWLLPRLFDAQEGAGGGRGVVPGVDYTDVDYRVYLDAADCIRRGGSPFDRHTYRYTPFLALLLAHLPRPHESGRYLFCVADAACGYIILNLRRRQWKRQLERVEPPSTACEADDALLVDSLWWLYNPFAINICTRGSAEALVLLPVLMTVRVLTGFRDEPEGDDDDVVAGGLKQRSSNTARHRWLVAVSAGLWHGIAVHAKIYPIIYTLSFAAYLSSPLDEDDSTGKRAGKASAIGVLVHWLRRLVSPLPVLFGVTTLASFAGLTYASYAMYGSQALQEGLLYHLSRVDHRHNYSIFWYWFYLSRGRAAEMAELTATASDAPVPPFGGGVALESSSFAALGRLLLVPQAALLLYVSLGVAPKRLGLALFVQTFAFVALNKVITAQYFTWYLVLLPLCSGEIDWSRPRVQASVAILGLSVLAWLASAYCLEMLGMAVHREVWMASILFFAANVNLLGALMSAVSLPSSRHGDQPLPPRRTEGIKND